MLVKHWMSTSVVTIGPDCTITEAAKLMKSQGIRMLPVLKNGQIEGIVTDRDLKRVSASEAISGHEERQKQLSQVRVDTIMIREVLTVPLDYTIQETAELLLEHKISGAPVMDAMGNIIGVITQTDIFKALLSVSGLGNEGVQFGLIVADSHNAIKEVDQVLRNYGGRLISTLTSNENLPKGYRKVFIRMSGIDRVSLGAISEELQEKGRLIYIIDHRDNIREVFL